MDNEQITKILNLDPYTRNHFQGVFPRDVFLKIDITTPNSPSFFICNLDNRGLPGSHWIAIEVNHADKKVLYFDSYGFPPAYGDLLLKLSSANYEIIWNDYTLQSFNSTVCGQYCILFCLLRSRKVPFQQIITLLQQQESFTPHDRDHTIYHFFKYNFPIVLSKLDSNIHNTSPFYLK